MTSGHYSERLDEALVLAASAFRDKTRKGSDVPYLTHLLQVAVWVSENGGDEEQTIAGLLHDYLEDIDGATEQEVRERFGARVAALVVALSDTTVRPKPPWQQRKESYLRKLKDESADVKLVAVCDKLHNARSILRDLRSHGDRLWGRFTATKEQNLWYYESVVEALSEGFSHPLLDELRVAVQQLATAGIDTQEAASCP